MEWFELENGDWINLQQCTLVESGGDPRPNAQAARLYAAALPDDLQNYFLNTQERERLLIFLKCGDRQQLRAPRDTP